MRDAAESQFSPSGFLLIRSLLHMGVVLSARAEHAVPWQARLIKYAKIIVLVSGCSRCVIYVEEKVRVSESGLSDLWWWLGWGERGGEGREAKEKHARG